MKSKLNLCRQRTPTDSSSLSKHSALIAQHPVLYFALCSLLLAPCFPAEAQQAKKVYRIGFLLAGPGPRMDEVREKPLRQGLQELGYIEGENVVIEWRFAKGDENRLPKLAAELVRLRPDVLLTIGTQPARALKDSTKTIPIVVISAGDLVGRGIVASLAKPGGNLTGFTSIAPELNGKRLELLKEIIPRVSQVAFLYLPHEEDELKELEAAARALGLNVQRHKVAHADQFQSAYTAMARGHADALLISSNPFTNSHRSTLIDLAAKYRLPAMCDGTAWTNAGCLISYAQDRTEGSRRAAVLIDKILKGAKPADLPVEQPTKFEFVINLKTAKEIGVTIPQSVLYRADKVIR